MLSFRSTTVATVIAGVLVLGPAPLCAQTDCNNNTIPDNCDLSCGPPGGACGVPVWPIGGHPTQRIVVAIAEELLQTTPLPPESQRG
jgi:hypothetical protein